MNDAQYLRPEWVMFGVREADGVVLFASSTLSEMEIRVEIETSPEEIFGILRHKPVDRVKWYDIHGRMRTFIMICGRDYAECLRNLHDHWNPDEETHAQEDRQLLGDRLLPAVPAQARALVQGEVAEPVD